MATCWNTYKTREWRRDWNNGLNRTHWTVLVIRAELCSGTIMMCLTYMEEARHQIQVYSLRPRTVK
ncbi:hypothetical protein Celaphus_00004813 [Cervus elaphus hippelaphus]|uniref:Uncharacterized protein n=1 Tax=Cervus elaphus hippelaphus TaxID=46360 RepID=A0A212DD12_CEREH|nr:hypothetical protein Celaphus_00004813 [Cervus elaphus hippelaphus]